MTFSKRPPQVSLRRAPGWEGKAALPSRPRLASGSPARCVWGGSHQRLTNRSRIIVGGPPQSRAAVKPLVSMATLTVVFPAAMVSRRSSVSHRCLPSPGRCLLSSSRVSGAVSDTGKEQIDYVRICDLVALGRKSRKERRREKEKRNALLANNLKPRSFEGPCFWLRSQVTEFA